MYQVPNFLMGNVQTDWSPVQNALAQYQKAQQFNATNEREYSQLAELARQHNMTNALARDNHALAVLTANRAEEDAPYRRALLEAQAAQARAHANYYGKATQKFDTLSGPNGAPQIDIDPTSGMGLDKEGNLVLPGNTKRNGSFDDAEGGAGRDQLLGPTIGGPRVESQVLGDVSQFNPTVQRAHADFGPVGTRASEVPGIVLTDKGASDQFATREARGQRALDSVPDDARARAINAQRTQSFFTQLYGKPPSGMAYSPDGKLIDLRQRESVQDRQSIAIAQEGLKALDYADNVLKKSGTATQIFGDTWKTPVGTVGGFGEAGRGFRSAKAAVLDLNFALSGKSVSNAEREAFLDLYMPSATDSRETQAWKISRMKSFFNTVLQTRQAGASDEKIAELYQRAILEGQKGAGGEQQKYQDRAPGAPVPRVDPRAERLKNKYGLE